MKSVLRRAPLLALAALAIVGTIAGGCGKKLNPLQVVNQSPEVRITSAPIDTNATCAPDPARSCYSPWRANVASTESKATCASSRITRPPR